MTGVTLNLSSLVDKINDRTLEILSRDNPDVRLEINSEGQLIFMSPTGGETGARNLELAFQIQLWNKQSRLGKVFDSSTGFKLSTGAIRSPDVSWISLEKCNALSRQQKRRYPPVTPDFVVELMSPTDVLEQVQDKMRQFKECGVKLGWLINPDEKQVEIYRQDQDKEILNNPQTLSGEDIMSELIVSLEEIFY